MERTHQSLGRKLLVLILALFAAITLTAAIHPQNASAATVTLKSVSYQSFRYRVRKCKAKKVKKGSTTLIFNSSLLDGTSKYRFIVFTAPKKKTYTFTFSELHELEPVKDIVKGSVFVYGERRGYLVAKTLKSSAGKRHFLYIDSPYGAISPTSGYFKVKLKKGQKIYFSVFGASSNSPHCRMNLNIR